MQQITITDSTTTYIRITQREARKQWLAGADNIAICPRNLRPGFPWACHMLLGQSEEHRESGFNKLVSWYNCTGNETGTYSAFYLVSN
jgi:hypothetical protein